MSIRRSFRKILVCNKKKVLLYMFTRLFVCNLQITLHPERHNLIQLENGTINKEHNILHCERNELPINEMCRMEQTADLLLIGRKEMVNAKTIKFLIS